MQLSSGKKNAPAAVEEERRPRAEAGSGGEMPAMPGAAHAAKEHAPCPLGRADNQGDAA